MNLLYLKIPKCGHDNIKVPIKIITSIPDKNQYMVYSSLTDKTFNVTEDEVKPTPVDSEYVVDTINTKSYYRGKNSLYKFAEEWELNSYEFEIIKRICRCRKKGEWLSDLIKTKNVIDIYIKEQKDNYNGRNLETSEKL